MATIKKLYIVVPPGLLAVLELFHASGHMNAVYASLAPQVDLWLFVHYAQLVLFPLTAWSVYRLSIYLDESRESNQENRSTDGEPWTTTLTAAALSIYAIGFASFDSIAGIGTGVLIKDSLAMLEALKSAPDAPQSFEQISSEIVQSYYHSPLVRYIFDVSKVAAIIGFGLTAWKLFQRGAKADFFAGMLLVGACYGVTKTHAPPYGPITYGFICLAGIAAIYFSGKKTPN